MQNLVDVLDVMKSGEVYLCSMSDTGQFKQGKEYSVHADSEGYLHIDDEFGDQVYGDEDLCSDDVWFTRVQKTKAPLKTIELPQLKTVELPKLVVEKVQPRTETVMTPSKIKETVQRLNGLTPAQAKLTELKQVSSQQKTVELDLAHLLLTSEAVKALKPGEDCIATSLVVDHGTSKVILGLSEGKVEREETEAVRVALEELLK